MQSSGCLTVGCSNGGLLNELVELGLGLGEDIKWDIYQLLRVLVSHCPTEDSQVCALRLTRSECNTRGGFLYR